MAHQLTTHTSELLSAPGAQGQGRKGGIRLTAAWEEGLLAGLECVPSGEAHHPRMEMFNTVCVYSTPSSQSVTKTCLQLYIGCAQEESASPWQYLFHCCPGELYILRTAGLYFSRSLPSGAASLSTESVLVWNKNGVHPNGRTPRETQYLQTFTVSKNGEGKRILMLVPSAQEHWACECFVSPLSSLRGEQGPHLVFHLCPSASGPYEGAQSTEQKRRGGTEARRSLSYAKYFGP